MELGNSLPDTKIPSSKSPEPSKPAIQPIKVKPAAEVDKVSEPPVPPERPKIVTTPGNRKKSANTPSIKEALSSLSKSKTPQEEEVEEEEETLENIDEIESETVTQELLALAWSEYIKRIKGDSTRIYLALNNQAPTLQKDGTTITLSFRNNALMTEFKQTHKPALLSYLRDHLHNQLLETEEIIIETEDDSQAKHYTDVDKFKHMVEKNPALQKLKQDFNLDFE